MDDNNELVCTKCGGHSFGEGILHGYAAVKPVGKIFAAGSPLILTICKECGEVMSMRVKKPEKF